MLYTIQKIRWKKNGDKKSPSWSADTAIGQIGIWRGEDNSNGKKVFVRYKYVAGESDHFDTVKEAQENTQTLNDEFLRQFLCPFRT